MTWNNKVVIMWTKLQNYSKVFQTLKHVKEVDGASDARRNVAVYRFRIVSQCNMPLLITVQRMKTVSNINKLEDPAVVPNL